VGDEGFVVASLNDLFQIALKLRAFVTRDKLRDELIEVIVADGCRFLRQIQSEVSFLFVPVSRFWRKCANARPNKSACFCGGSLFSLFSNFLRDPDKSFAWVLFEGEVFATFRASVVSLDCIELF
jgi:hypothetical protein